MRNLLTWNEVLEQFGNVELGFDAYVNQKFIFKGSSKDWYQITLLLDARIVHEVNIETRVRLAEVPRIQNLLSSNKDLSKEIQVHVLNPRSEKVFSL